MLEGMKINMFQLSGFCVGIRDQLQPHRHTHMHREIDRQVHQIDPNKHDQTENKRVNIPKRCNATILES